MTLSLVAANAWHWVLQIFLLVGATGLTLGLLRAHDPRLRLRVWHGVVVVSLLLPLLQPWQAMQSLPDVVLQTEPTAAVDWPIWIAAVVMAGIAVRAGWLAAGLLKLRRLRRRADPWRPLPGWYARMAQSIGAAADVSFSHDVPSAVTFGFRRPSILVPRALGDAPDPHQRAVLAHELTHVARRDWLWVLGEEAVRTVLWCHPAIWFALGEAQLAREEVVDRRAIAATGNRGGYLEALVAAAAPAPAATLGFGPQFYRRRQLETRIRRLLQEHAMSTTRLIAMTSFLALTVPATILAGGHAFPLFAAADATAIQQVPPPPPAPPPPPPAAVPEPPQPPAAAKAGQPPPPPAPPAPPKPPKVIKKSDTTIEPTSPYPPAPPKPAKVFREGDLAGAPKLPPPPPPAPPKPAKLKVIDKADKADMSQSYPPKPPKPPMVIKKADKAGPPELPPPPPPPPPPPAKIGRGGSR